MGKKDCGLGIGAIVLGIAAFVYFQGLPGAAGSYPKLVSAAIVILGILILVGSFKAAKQEEPAQKEKKNISYKTVALIVVYLFAYYFLFQYVGYVIPTFLMMLATSVTLGYRNWKVLIPTDLLISIGLYLAFTQLFHVRFMGLFF